MEKNIANEDTGLSPLQEKAIFLLASGKSATSTAIEIGVDRATLYNWLKLTEFEDFYNRIRWEIRTQTTNELINLYSHALNAIKESIHSDNESIKLKASFYVLDKIENLNFGSTSKTVIQSNIVADW